MCHCVADKMSCAGRRSVVPRSSWSTDCLSRASCPNAVGMSYFGILQVP